MDKCAFDTLFAKNVPHILEKIFLSLDHKSFRQCRKVCQTWKKLLSTESYLKREFILWINECKENKITEAEIRKHIKLELLFKRFDTYCGGRFMSKKEFHVVCRTAGVCEDIADKMLASALSWLDCSWHQFLSLALKQ